MKRILLLILGYFLILQAALGVFMCCGQPENAVYILIVSGFSAWGGYKLIQIAGRPAQIPTTNEPDDSDLERERMDMIRRDDTYPPSK
jgi:hypothetical protein